MRLIDENDHNFRDCILWAETVYTSSKEMMEWIYLRTQMQGRVPGIINKELRRFLVKGRRFLIS